ncbi:DUF2911 domain-containing protein [Sediminibacterium sp.]|uniref:DUF2911 domain-containing protein n=1 Tax=Sediminibacterium sp. TaxID=1917865 RepID=UPI00273698C3|nr:DUF2911 domain-containing protein [Sediminibacterium sp.]MDP3393747.1 DUF2911 domain-containing protein [Sediminibacterium sp.]MDP3566479.1 DUF2911 domain-containing protein [Sediminibacterium sp.]
MKKTILSFLFAFASLSMLTLNAQTTPKPKPSPAAEVSAVLTNGAALSIKYSQPSLKGRTPGKDIEPMMGKIWRAGANDATVFETSKDLKVNGQLLPAGKYSIFTLQNEKATTLIFNKTWKQWGAFQYKEADDALRIVAKQTVAADSSEKLEYTISNKGLVVLKWGTINIEFTVE